jgi:integrase
MAKLTVAAIEKIRPHPTKRLEIPDTLPRGLYLVVQPLPSGVRSWAVRYRNIAGKTRKLTLGGFPAINLTEARDLAQTALFRVAKGADPAVEKKIARHKAAGADDTFEAVARQFIDKHQKPKNRTWQQAAWYLGLIPDTDHPDKLAPAKGGLVDRWGDRKLAAITKADVIAATDRDSIVENRRLAVLSKLFNWAISRDLLSTNPVAGVAKPAVEKSRDRVLTDDELVAVWKAATDLSWPFGDVVRLLILTGQRRGEVAEMRWSEVDLARRVWILPAARSKNDAEHEIPLSPQALAIIEQLPRQQNADLVFTTTGHTPISGFSNVKEKLDAKSGVSKWTVHDLRRTLATGLQRLGTRLEVTEAVLNHVSGSRGGVTGIYQRHTWATEKRAALEAWARHVAGLIEPAPANVTPLYGRAGAPA